MPVQKAPLQPFARPQDRYDSQDEAQFRLSVERAIQDTMELLTRSRTGTPVALDAGDNNDYSIGSVSTFLRLTANAGASAITGIADGRGDRRLVLVNISANTLTLEHEDTASVAANRIISPTGSAITLVLNDMAELYYDSVSIRWRVLSTLA